MRSSRRLKIDWRRFLLTIAVLTLASWAIVASLLHPLPSRGSDELAAAQPHPLPASLQSWQDPSQSGTYFDQIQPISAGYLIWSQFPVTVYVEPGMDARSQAWVRAVQQAVAEWNRYLPLQAVTQPETADIQILRKAPPLRLQRSAEGPGFSLGRARAAEARFELFTRQDANAQKRLAHRFTVWLRPDQAPVYTHATARHELGHALGIWGHSPHETDVMYFSQVRNPPPISARDVNTLKQIYQQPTRLGHVIHSPGNP